MKNKYFPIRVVVCAMFTFYPVSVIAAMSKKVAIVMWDANEPRYVQTKDGIINELNAQGFKDGLILNVEDAGANKAKVGDIINKLRLGKTDIFVPLGTSVAVPMAKAITDKPIVFSMVYNPVEVKIAKTWLSSGNNTTGSSSFVSVANLMFVMIKRSGERNFVRRLFVLYAPKEANSVLQLDGVMSVKKALGFEVVPVPFSADEDVTKWAQSLPPSRKGDLILLTGSAIVGKNAAAIVKASIKSRMMTLTTLDDIAAKGVLFGLVADPSQIGHLAGKALASVLRGAAPSSIKIEYPLPKLIINDNTAREGGFVIPPSFREWASDVR